MRWTKGNPGLRLLFPGVVLGTLLLLAAAPPSEEKRLFVYSPQTDYTVRIDEVNGAEYASLFDVLRPLGEATSSIAGHKWKLRFNKINAEFDDRRPRARVGNLKVDLPTPPVFQGTRGLVPFAALPTLVSQFLDMHVSFHAAGRRLLIGDVEIRFTATLKKTDPPSVALHFTGPVNPTISTGGGELRMVFRHQPVVSLSETFHFDTDAIASANYSESTGVPEITVRGARPLMATFSDAGKTITITAAPSSEAAAPTTPPAAAPESSAATTAPPPTPAPSAPGISGVVSAKPRYLVVIDAAHGGDERGAALTDSLAEKDVTLAVAYKLRTELQNRGINTFLVREGDTAVALDQRAAIANESRAAVYVSVHADVMGTGVHVYTSLLPAAENTSGPFLPWDDAQAPFQPASRMLANAVLNELDNRQITSLMQPAPLRPLNNVAAAAIAVELAPPKPDVNSLTASYEQSVASAVATAIVNVRSNLERAR